MSKTETIQFTDFYEAYHFLKEHPMTKLPFKDNPQIYHNGFERCLDIEIVKVNPKTNAIDSDDNLNTEIRVWLEFGKLEYNEYVEEGYYSFIANHDTRLDCGGKTFEEAIIKLANLVKLYYHDNGKEIKLAQVKTEIKNYALIRGGARTSYIMTEVNVYDNLNRAIKSDYIVFDRLLLKEIDKEIDIFEYEWKEIKSKKEIDNEQDKK